MSDTKENRIPTWAKLLVASLFGAGGSGGLSTLPIYPNAEEAYEVVKEEYPAAEIQTRSWAPHSHKVISEEGAIFVRTSIIDGEIVDTW